MHVTYSPDIEGIYVTVSDEPVASSVEISDLVTVDLDAAGNPVGVEFVMRAENLSEDHWRAVYERFPQLSPSTSVRANVLDRVLPILRHQLGRAPIVEASDETQTVVIGVRDDTVAETAGHVSALGGVATVAVPQGHLLVPLTWDMTLTDIELDLGADSNVHPDSALGMLVDYMATQTVFSFRIAVSESQQAAIEGSEKPLMQLA